MHVMEFEKLRARAGQTDGQNQDFQRRASSLLELLNLLSGSLSQRQFISRTRLSCFLVCAVVVLCSVFLCLYSLPSGVINK